MHEHELGVDEDRAAAVDVLVLLADAGARWGEYEHALDLLDAAEDAGLQAPASLALRRRSWTLAADRALAR